MKVSHLTLLILVFNQFGCEMRLREKELEKRADSINQKEQALLLLQNKLDLKNSELLAKERMLDSLLKKTLPSDTINQKQLFLIGRWNVKMVCTETTCAGSAVGDNKTEVWDISYQNNTIIAQAFVNNKLVRLYSGTATSTEVTLTAQQDAASEGVNISVNLLIKNETTLEGERRILRPDECRILYSIQMEKIIIS